MITPIIAASAEAMAAKADGGNASDDEDLVLAWVPVVVSSRLLVTKISVHRQKSIFATVNIRKHKIL